jgi:predicted RNase H-like HicB family nuclease
MNVPDAWDGNRRYSMIIEWSEEDRAFIVTVPELPGCMTHGATYAEAVRQGEDAIATWLDTARAYGDPIPAPRLFARAHAGTSV